MDREVGTVLVQVRRTDGVLDEERSWPVGMAEAFQPAAPWRTFRWLYGQKHYSGTYWSSTMSDHVIYESRLELTRLLYADFDHRVRAVYAQPFLMKTEGCGGTSPTSCSCARGTCRWWWTSSPGSSCRDRR